MMRIAYLNEMTTISDQKISDTMPSTASGVICPVGTGGLRRDIERIERARADVAEHDAHAGERGRAQRPRPSLSGRRQRGAPIFAVALIERPLARRFADEP